MRKTYYLFESLWLANILDLLFFNLIIALFFSDSLQLSLRGSVMEMLVHIHVLVNAQ